MSEEILHKLSALTAVASMQREAAYKRSLHKKLNFYYPHPKQQAFHDSPAYCRIVLAGNRMGKTTCLIAEAISYCLGERPWNKTKTRNPPSKVLIGIEDFTHTAVTSVGAQIEAFIPDGALLDGAGGRKTIHNGIVSTWAFKNGSILTLYSYKQERGSVEGGDWDFIGFNEPPPEWFYIGTTRGLIDRGGRIAFAATLLSEPWIYDKILERVGTDPDYWSVEGWTDDNPYLGEKEKNRFFQTLSPEEVDARRYGKPSFLQGRIFKQYSPNTHLLHKETFYQRLKAALEKDPSSKLQNDFSLWPKGMALDPHLARPPAIIWFAINPLQQMIVFDEWPNEQFERMRQGYSLEAIAALIREKESTIPGGPQTIKWRALDPNAGRTASARSGQILERDFDDLGIYFDTRISDNVDLGVMRIRDRLDCSKGKEPSLFVLSNCVNLHNSMMRWSVDPETMKPKEDWKDFADCFDEETEILSENGWVKFPELAAKVRVATRSKKGELEYQIPTEYFSYQYDGEMVVAQARGLDFKVTPNHRMLVYPQSSKLAWRLAKDLLRQDTVPISSLPFRGKASGSLRFGLSDDDWCEFLGWYLSEGSCTGTRGGKVQTPGRGYQVMISQVDGEKADRIHALMRKTGFNVARHGTNFIISNKCLWKELFPLGNSETKRIPRYVFQLAASSRKRLWESLVLGDGWTHHGSEAYCTISPGLADDITELLATLGYASGWSERIPKDSMIRGRLVHAKFLQYHIRRRTTDGACLTNGKKEFLLNREHYSGMVYCVTVPNGTVLVRRNKKQFFAGNCCRYSVMLSPKWTSSEENLESILRTKQRLEAQWKR